MHNINFRNAGKDFADGVYQSFSSKFDGRMSKSLLDKIGELIKEIFTSIGQAFKDHFKLRDAGKTIGDEFSEFIKGMNFKKFAQEFTNEFNEGMKGATENFDFKTPGENFGKQFGEGIKGAGKPMADAMGEITGDLFRNITWNSVPYLASAALVLLGVPLGAYYCYYRAKHNIGRPKLATEMRKVGILDQTQEKITKAGASAFDVFYSGAKWSAIAGGVSLATYLPALIGYALTGPSNNDFERFRDAYHIIGAGLTIGSGVLASTGTLVSKIKNWAMETFFAQAEPKPIFHKELEKQIEEISESTRNLQKNGGYFQNVILYGPGGTGKTMVAKAIARNSGMNYVMMSGGDLAQYIKRGEHVTELNKLFEDIQKSSTPTVLFIDEMESLCGDRNQMDRSELFELLNAFLSHTGKESKKVMIIGATNLLRLIDDAVLSRMDHKLYIGPPNLEIRRRILEQYLERFFTSDERAAFFPASLVAEIAQKTDGLTGRAVFKMVNALSSKKMATKDLKLTPEMVWSVIDHFVSQEEEVERRKGGTPPTAVKKLLSVPVRIAAPAA